MRYTLALLALAASAQTLPDLPNAGKLATLRADLPHTLAACNRSPTTAAELQAALSEVVCGQTICLAAGTTYTGTFTYSKSCSSSYITMRSTMASGLPSGVRVEPDDATKMPKLVATNPAGPIIARPGSSGLRMIGLEVLATSRNANLVVLGSNGPTQTTPDRIPVRFIIDRSYIHCSTNVECGVGIRIDANYVSVVNSYIDEIHNGSGDDQAILIINSQGPVLITNNYLHAAGENFMIGGGEPAMRLVPSDIYFGGNYVWKDPSRKNNHPLYIVKNLFELKTGRRLLVEGNVFENFWSGFQSQFFAIVMKTANQKTPCRSSWNGFYNQTAHITMRYNKIINVPQAVTIGRVAACDQVESGSSHFYVHNNVITGLGSGHSHFNADAAPKFFMWSYPFRESDGRFIYPRHVTFEHNTVGSLGVGSQTWGLNQYRYIHKESNHTYVEDFYWRSNIMPGRWFAHGTYNSATTINTFFPARLVARNNISVSPSSTVFPANPNYGVANYTGLFVNQAGGNYRLAGCTYPTGTCAYQGHDGHPAGADISRVDACTAGAVDGDWELTPACGGAPGPVSVTLTANGSEGPIEVASGANVALDWTVVDGDTCTAHAEPTSALWTGSKSAAGGTLTINPTTSATYYLVCEGGGSDDTAQVTVNIRQTGVCSEPPL